MSALGRRSLVAAVAILALALPAFGQKPSTSPASKPAIVPPQIKAILKWTFQESLYPDKLHEDYNFLFSSMEEIHPNPYAYLMRSEFQSQRNQGYLRIRIITRADFYHLLAPIIAQLRCGHMYMAPFRDQFTKYCDAGGLVIPLSVRIVEDKVLVAASGQDGPPRGSEILTINNEAIDNFVSRNGGRFAAERKAANPYLLEDPQLLCNMLWVDHSAPAELAVKVKLADGTEKEFTIAGVKWEEFVKQIPGAKPANSFKAISSEKMVVINLPVWTEDEKEFKNFLDDAFTLARQKKAASVVIDVRDNPGGDPNRAKMLISYLNDKPFKLYEDISVKLSKQFSGNLEEKFPWMQGQEEGKVITQYPMPIKQDNPVRFSGKVYVLMGKNSAGSTVAFLSAAHYYKLAMLVGEETMDTVHFYGDPVMVELPNSGLKLAVPSKKFDCVEDHPDYFGPMKLNHVVAQKVADFRVGIDTAMQFTLGLIQSAKNPERF